MMCWWRSLLFVPAHVERFVAAASTRGADGYILDLEDSVPVSQKVAARAALHSAIVQVSKSSATVLVRVNSEPDLLSDDLSVAVDRRIAALVLPKVEDPEQVQIVSRRLDVLELRTGVPLGSTLLIAQIEDVRALPCLDAIAASSQRLVGLSLGSEDFSASAGMAPTFETLFGPNQQIVFACRRRGITPLGFPGSIADFSDIDRFSRTIQMARQMGFGGAFCVHPSQIPILNAVFSPSAAEVAEAQEILAAYDAAASEGRSAAAYANKMIDPPVATRARALVARAKAFHLTPGTEQNQS